VNLGDGGPDSGAILPVSLPEVVVGFCSEFFCLAIVIRPVIGPPAGLDIRTAVIPGTYLLMRLRSAAS
jgi:hypothetical protein